MADRRLLWKEVRETSAEMVAARWLGARWKAEDRGNPTVYCLWLDGKNRLRYELIFGWMQEDGSGALPGLIT